MSGLRTSPAWVQPHAEHQARGHVPRPVMLATGVLPALNNMDCYSGDGQERSRSVSSNLVVIIKPHLPPLLPRRRNLPYRKEVWGDSCGWPAAADTSVKNEDSDPVDPGWSCLSNKHPALLLPSLGPLGARDLESDRPKFTRCPCHVRSVRPGVLLCNKRDG